MSYLIFHLGGRRYGLDTSHIVEIVPLLDFIPLSNVPQYVAGRFQYRGKSVTAVDLINLMTGNAHRKCFSTRIVVVDYPMKEGFAPLLGLIVERATDLVRFGPENVAEVSASDESESFELFDVEDSLPPAAMIELLR